MYKKLLSALLSASMLVSMVPFVSQAAAAEAMTASDVNTAAVNAAKVFDVELPGVTGVSVNDTALTAEQYEFKDGRLLITADVFSAAGDYAIVIANGEESEQESITLTGSITKGATRNIGTNAERFARENYTFYPLGISDSEASVGIYLGTDSSGNLITNNDINVSVPKFDVSNELPVSSTTTWDEKTDETTLSDDELYAQYTATDLSGNALSGEYEVEYFAPYSSAGYAYAMTIPDTDVIVSDKNGVVRKQGTKKVFFDDEGYRSIGTYDFGGENDYIRVVVDQNSVMKRSQGDKRLARRFHVGSVRFTPAKNESGVMYYYNTGKAFIDAVNEVKSGAELESVLTGTEQSFVDTKALKNMMGVYQTLAAGVPYDSENDFIKAFETEIKNEKYVKKVVYTSSTPVNVDGNGNYNKWECTDTVTKYISFSDVATKNIIDVEFNAVVGQFGGYVNYGNDMLINAYSYTGLDVDGNTVHDKNSAAGKALTSFLSTAEINELTAPEKVSYQTKLSDSFADILSNADGTVTDFTIRVNSDPDLNGDGTDDAILRSAYSTYITSASLTINYDISAYIDTPAVNTVAINAPKVFDLEGFTAVNSVKVNGEAIDSSLYSFKTGRALVDASVFNSVGAYELEFTQGSNVKLANITLTGSTELNMTDDFWVIDSESGATTTAVTTAEYSDYGYNKIVRGASAGAYPYDRDDVYVQFTGMPKGRYDVEYYMPYNTTLGSSVNHSILDQDITVTDKNGSHVTTGVKKSNSGPQGWVEIGTYEFDGSNDKVNVTVNPDSKNICFGENTPYPRFVPGKLRFTPAKNEALVKYYYENGTEMIDDINAADSEAELKAVIKKDSAGYIDKNALNNIDVVIGELAAAKPEAGYASEYSFKKAFNDKVKTHLTTKSIANTYLLGKYGDEQKHYLDHTSISAAFATPVEEKYLIFNDVPTVDENNNKIHSVELKLNFDRYNHDFVVEGYSLTDYAPELGSRTLGQILSDWNSAGYKTTVNFTEKQFTDTASELVEQTGTVLGDTLENALKSKEDDKTTTFSLNLAAEFLNNEMSNVVYSSSSGRWSKLTGAELVITYDDTQATDLLSIAKNAAAAKTLADCRSIIVKYAQYLGVDASYAQQYAAALWQSAPKTEEDVQTLLDKALTNEIILSDAKVVYSGSDLSGSVIIRNVSAEAQPVTVIAAAYTGGRMIEAYMLTGTEPDAFNISTYTFSGTADNAEYIKFFAWENMTTLKPYDEALKKEFIDDSLTYAADEVLLTESGEINSEYAGDLTIAFMGGSLTNGDSDYYGSQEISDTKWTAQMTSYIKEQYPEANVKVINAAASGSGSQFGADYIQADVLSYSPDIIFMEHTANDRGVTNAAAKQCYFESEIYQTLTKADKVPAIIYMHLPEPAVPTDSYKAAISAKDEVADYYGIKTINVNQGLYDKYLASESTDSYITWLNSNSYYLNWAIANEKLDVHPGIAGYEMFGTIIKEAFAENGFASYITRTRTPDELFTLTNHGAQYISEFDYTRTVRGIEDLDAVYEGSWETYDENNTYTSTVDGINDMASKMRQGVKQTLDTTGCTIEFTTTANELAIITSYEQYGRKAEVFVDGVSKGTVNPILAGFTWFEMTSQYFKISDDNSEHTVKIVVDDPSAETNNRVFRFKGVREINY